MLIVFSGLPGTGKSTVSAALARTCGFMHLRIDVIEQAIRNSGVADVDASGYLVARDLAVSNLRLGLTVVVDAVNAEVVARDMWWDAARVADVSALDIEIVCSDASEHRRRVESRASDIEGLKLPTWDEVLARNYAPWNRNRLVVDTARVAVDAAVDVIRRSLGHDA